MKKNSLLKKWTKTTPFMKLISTTEILVSITIIILTVLHITNIIENANNIFIPLLSVLIILLAIQNWKKNRSGSILLLIIFLFTIFISILKLFK